MITALLYAANCLTIQIWGVFECPFHSAITVWKNIFSQTLTHLPLLFMFRSNENMLFFYIPTIFLRGFFGISLRIPRELPKNPRRTRNKTLNLCGMNIEG